MAQPDAALEAMEADAEAYCRRSATRLLEALEAGQISVAHVEMRELRRGASILSMLRAIESAHRATIPETVDRLMLDLYRGQ